MSRRTGRPRKLPPPLFRWVVSVYFGRHATQCEIARFLGMSQSTVCRIVSGFHSQSDGEQT